MATCWNCHESEYHNYKDRYGIRCPMCGQKQSDDPASKPKVVVTEAPKVPTSRARSKA